LVHSSTNPLLDQRRGGEIPDIHAMMVTPNSPGRLHQGAISPAELSWILIEMPGCSGIEFFSTRGKVVGGEGRQAASAMCSCRLRPRAP